MLKDYNDITLSRYDIYQKVIAQKAIFTLNYFADSASQYCLSEVEQLIDKYNGDRTVLLNMMNLKQLFKYSVEETGQLKLNRTAVEALLIIDFEKVSNPQEQLKQLVALVRLGHDGKNVLYDRLRNYQNKYRFIHGDEHRKESKELIAAIAEKAKKTLDHLAQEEYTCAEIKEMIVKYLSEEKDIYRLLNFHEFYGQDNIQYSRNELLKEAIFCLIKDHITFEKAVEFSSPRAGRTSRKELDRIVNNLKIKENNKKDIVRLIERSADIKALKSALAVSKDEDLITLLAKYDLLGYIQERYPEYFQKVELSREELFINSTQFKLRRIFAEVLINEILDLEELAYFVLGRRDQDVFISTVRNCEALVQLYPVSFEEFWKLKDERLRSGKALLAVMREAILGSAFDSYLISDKEFSQKYKKYNLEKIIRDIKWHLDRDNIDFNIKSEQEIVELISRGLDQHGPNIYTLEQKLGGEIRKTKDEIFDLIVAHELLSEKYERLENIQNIEKLGAAVKRIDLDELELLLLEDKYNEAERQIIENELQVRSAIAAQLAEEKRKKEQKQRSTLEKEYEKIAKLFEPQTQQRISSLLRERKIEELAGLILALGLNIKAKLYIAYDGGNKFLRELEIEREILNEIKLKYTPADGQFTKGHMEKIKKLWGLTSTDVHALGDIIGHNGRKARK